MNNLTDHDVKYLQKQIRNEIWGAFEDDDAVVNAIMEHVLRVLLLSRLRSEKDNATR